jgi:hypothetical protein
MQCLLLTMLFGGSYKADGLTWPKGKPSKTVRVLYKTITGLDQISVIIKGRKQEAASTSPWSRRCTLSLTISAGFSAENTTYIVPKSLSSVDTSKKVCKFHFSTLQFLLRFQHFRNLL